MSIETDVLKRFFAAINRNDMQASIEDFASEIVRIERGRGTWAEGSCEPEKLLQNADKVVVYLHARARLKDSTEWTDGRFADGFVFRNGKIVQYRSFGEREEALKWAGIEEE